MFPAPVICIEITPFAATLQATVVRIDQCQNCYFMFPTGVSFYDSKVDRENAALLKRRCSFIMNPASAKIKGELPELPPRILEPNNANYTSVGICLSKEFHRSSWMLKAATSSHDVVLRVRFAVANLAIHRLSKFLKRIRFFGRAKLLLSHC